MKNCLSNQSLLLAFNSSGSKSVPDSATGAAQGDAKPAEKKGDQFWGGSLHQKHQLLFS
jgi:hypothetical protein